MQPSRRSIIVRVVPKLTLTKHFSIAVYCTAILSKISFPLCVHTHVGVRVLDRIQCLAWRSSHLSYPSIPTLKVQCLAVPLITATTHSAQIDSQPRPDAQQAAQDNRAEEHMYMGEATKQRHAERTAAKNERKDKKKKAGSGRSKP